VLSGYPSASGTFSFWVRVSDARPSSVDQLLSLIVNSSTNNPHLIITSPKWLGHGQFQFTLDTAASIKYTPQISTNLKTWIPMDSFSGSGGPLTIVADSATNTPRFYRVKIGP